MERHNGSENVQVGNAGLGRGPSKMESRRRWLCWDIVIMKNEEREQMNMLSFFQLKVLSAKSDSFNYSCMGRKYSKTLFWEQGETL